MEKKCLHFYVAFRTQADPSLALQRSRSSLQLKESREDDDSKDLPWAQDIQEILGPMQDTSFNRSEPFRPFNPTGQSPYKSFRFLPNAVVRH